MKLRPAKEFGDFQAPLRNIRMLMDGTWLQLDLLPSIAIEPSTEMLQDSDPRLRGMKEQSKLIVEASRFLRLTFDLVGAVKIFEEFCDPDLGVSPEEAGRLPGGGLWPVCEVLGDDWRSTFPDHSVAGHPARRHWKIWSMETAVELLGDNPAAQWLEQSV